MLKFDGGLVEDHAATKADNAEAKAYAESLWAHLSTKSKTGEVVIKQQLTDAERSAIQQAAKSNNFRFIIRKERKGTAIVARRMSEGEGFPTRKGGPRAKKAKATTAAASL